ncbi:MARC1 protein, partial [Tichodroma muraria]|nr:MARC1 protein [Tichodroma muraria]
RVFGQDIQGRDCGDEVAQWLTTFLNSEPCRLVHFEPSMLPRKSKDTIPLFRNTDEVNECSFPLKSDTWEDILIGDVELKGTVCCGRCILTTVNPDTGIIDRKEPLETLK